MSEIPTHEIMQAYAEDAVRFAKSRFGIVLDYSEQSLVSVDDMLAKMTPQGVLDENELPNKLRDEIWTLCQVVGGYVGAVIIKHIGAQWETVDVSEKEVEIKLKIAGRITAQPHMKVWKRLIESETDMIIGYYRAIQHMLGLKKFLPPELGGPEVKSGSQHHDVMNYLQSKNGTIGS